MSVVQVYTMKWYYFLNPLSLSLEHHWLIYCYKSTFDVSKLKGALYKMDFWNSSNYNSLLLYLVLISMTCSYFNVITIVYFSLIYSQFLLGHQQKNTVTSD